MTDLIIVLIVALLLLTAVALKRAPRRRPVSATVPAPDGGARRTLFPFVAHALSQRALDAALRLARADDASPTSRCDCRRRSSSGRQRSRSRSTRGCSVVEPRAMRYARRSPTSALTGS
jgi:hypothetical protein